MSEPVQIVEVREAAERYQLEQAEANLIWKMGLAAWVEAVDVGAIERWRARDRE